MNISDKKLMQTYYWLRNFIDEKKFSDNLKLPSENALVIKLGMSRSTIRGALELLCEEKLIIKKQGSGTYINKYVAAVEPIAKSGAKYRICVVLQGQDKSANKALLKGINSILSEQNGELHIFYTDNKFKNERFCLENITHQNFDGFIIDAVKGNITNPNSEYYQQLYNKRVPIVFYNNYYKELSYPHITVNDAKCTQQLVEELINKNHKKIAGIFVCDNYQSIEKFRGYSTALVKNNIAFNDDYIKLCISDEAHSEGYNNQIVKFLKQCSSCTAIVCCNQIILDLVQIALKQIGKKVPQDISVVCLDYSKDDWQLNSITCSVHQGYDIGKHAITSLLAMIDNKDFHLKNYSKTLNPKIYIGESVKSLKYTTSLL